MRQNNDPTEFTPIILDSISTDKFPDVPIYVRQGSNYTLYKNSGIAITPKDIKRLRMGNEFAYTPTIFEEDIQTYLEENIHSILKEEIPLSSKNSVLVPILLNYLNDIFKEPALIEQFERCKGLLHVLIGKLSSNEDLTDLFSKLAQNGSYLLTHSTQVAVLSMLIHKKMYDVEFDELLDVGIGGMFHDCGMMEVSSNILHKKDTLLEQERQRLKHHPRYSKIMMQKMGILEPLPLSIALNHHERFDGTGYPAGISGTSIPRSALVVGLCDVYCTLTTNRPYSPALSHDDAIDVLNKEKSLFHPDILRGFINTITAFKIPSTPTPTVA